MTILIWINWGNWDEEPGAEGYGYTNDCKDPQIRGVKPIRDCLVGFLFLTEGHHYCLFHEMMDIGNHEEFHLLVFPFFLRYT